MEVIIAEKAIAGRRIASILAGKEVPAQSIDGAQTFSISKEQIMVPLRGHVMDVEFPPQYTQWASTDLKQLTQAPINYLPTANAILKYLKKIAPQISRVIIATDADREGESIGLEALRAIKAGNKNVEVKRAYFSALTEKDIKPAFKQLRPFDYAFADSADVRREIDLVWGAVLTRFLSLSSGRLGKSFLSAGRVQIPTLALIVQREKERKAFEIKPYWEVHAQFEKNKQSFAAEHSNGKFWKKEEADAVLKAKDPPKGVVKKIAKKKRTLAKPLPFNTTGYLRAATAIGLSAGNAMSVAESLYQRGYVSYPRTDNTVYSKTLDLKSILYDLKKISEFALDVEKVLGQKQIIPSRGKETKDHPPIHPATVPEKSKLNALEWKVYELIVRRFLATLYEDAITENVTVSIDLNKQPFVAHGQVFVKKGWKALYPYSQTQETFLPPLAERNTLNLKKLEQLSKETTPPNRYSEGALIKLMEQNGLGTKATRHNIIQKLFARKYISGPKSLIPSTVAFAVIEVLEKNVKDLVKPKMTADLEKEMDRVAAGKVGKGEIVDSSRAALLKLLEKMLLHKDEIGNEIRNALREDSVLADCTVKGCKGQLIMRRGRTGKRFAGCNAYPKCTNSFPLSQKGTITATNKLCEECGQPIILLKFMKGKAFPTCLNMDCKTKDEWKKKQAEKTAVTRRKTNKK